MLIGELKRYLGEEYPYRGMLLFLGKTILFFFLINYFFIAYTGLTIPGGRFFNSFILEHADFITAFRRFLLWGGAQFATLIGYPSGYTDFTMFIRGESGVRMVYSCMGFGLIAAWSALVLAWSAGLKDKLIGLASGISIIVILNMIRIGGLAILFSNGYYNYFDFINHHDLFNIIIVILIFLLFTWHIKHTTRQGALAKDKSVGQAK